jgi:hypothetical protein
MDKTIEQGNANAVSICHGESLIVGFSAIHRRANEIIESACAAFLLLPNSVR